MDPLRCRGEGLREQLHSLSVFLTQVDLERSKEELDRTLTALEESEYQHNLALKELKRTQGLVRVLEEKADRRKRKAQSARLALHQEQVSGSRRCQTFQGRN